MTVARKENWMVLHIVQYFEHTRDAWGGLDNDEQASYREYRDALVAFAKGDPDPAKRILYRDSQVWAKYADTLPLAHPNRRREQELAFEKSRILIEWSESLGFFV